jgi:hypothetical protein
MRWASIQAPAPKPARGTAEAHNAGAVLGRLAPGTAGASASQRLPAARPHRPVGALLPTVPGGRGGHQR